MQKSMQNKLITICVIIGTIIIGAIGLIFISNISGMNSVNDVVEVTKKYIIVSILIFIFTSVVSIVILNRMIKKSMVNIMKDAGKIVTGNNSKVKLLQDGNKSRDEFMSAFDDATLEIREHLRDVDKQKKQIETILLHMTDGILAFNLEGEVTHKNIAAERLLNLSEEDDDFEKIFSKINVDIN